MMCESLEKLQILSAHYSETYAFLQVAVKKRDKLFVIVLILMVVLSVFASAPDPWKEWVNTLVVSTASEMNPTSDTLFDIHLIATLLWFALLAVGHTYFQTVLHIQRQYEYVYTLEDKLNPVFGGVAFTREGDHYTQHSKEFSKWTKIIFWAVTPFILFLFIIFWVIAYYFQFQPNWFYGIVNGGILGLFVTSMVLYLMGLWRKTDQQGCHSVGDTVKEGNIEVSS